MKVMNMEYIFLIWKFDYLWHSWVHLSVTKSHHKCRNSQQSNSTIRIEKKFQFHFKHCKLKCGMFRTYAIAYIETVKKALTNILLGGWIFCLHQSLCLLKCLIVILISFILLQTEQFTVLWILFAVIVLGNSAVLVTLYLNKRKSRMNFFIKQLAIAGNLTWVNCINR